MMVKNHVENFKKQLNQRDANLKVRETNSSQYEIYPQESSMASYKNDANRSNSRGRISNDY
jgi:hypothetical protein